MATRLAKPSQPIIQWGTTLTRGLVVCIPFFEKSGTKARNLGRYGPSCDGVFTGTPAWNKQKFGSSVQYAAVTDYINLGTKVSTTITADVTCLIIRKKDDSTNRGSVGFYTAYTLATNRFGAHLPFSDGNVYWQYGGSAGNNSLSASGLSFSTSDVWVFTIGVRGSEIWQNGILRASNTAATGITRTAEAINFQINRQDVNSTGDLATDSAFYVWDRQLSMREIAVMSTYPFIIFKNFSLEKRLDHIFGPTPASAAARSNIGYRALLGVGL